MEKLLGIVYGSPRPIFKVTEVNFVNYIMYTALPRYLEKEKLAISNIPSYQRPRVFRTTRPAIFIVLIFQPHDS
jgi:hypothetical protein